MIYNNQGGNIGFSSSKQKPKIKKLFTPIKISNPILSDIKNYREKSLTNSPRKETNRKFQKKKFPSQLSKTTFILQKKNSNSTGNSPMKKKSKKENSKKNSINLKRSKSKVINQNLDLFNEIYDSLVKSLKKEKREKHKVYKSIKTVNYSLNQQNDFKQIKFKYKKSITKPIKNNSTLSTNNIFKILNTPFFNSLEDEAKSMTNTIEIQNFYEYTKNCMRIIVELKENKTKASIPNKVKILNPDKNQKLAIFDLDETLIHGVVNIKNYKNEKNIISVITPSKKIAKIGVNIRPNWEKAIKRIKKLYTIVIYTASHSSYADAVLNFLDPENKYFYNRLYRSNCIDVKLNGKDFYIKDMNIFEDFDPKNILIVDNSVMAFAYDLDNGIPILPYYDAEKDLELLFVAYYFESLYHYDDLRIINKEYMKLDYYLNQAIEEYKNEIEEEENNDINDNFIEKENKLNCDKNNSEENLKKRNSMKNLLFGKKENSIKKSKRRHSVFVEQYEIDFNLLRHKFSKDEEEKKNSG